MRPAPFIELPSDNPVFATVVPLLGLGSDGAAVQSGSGFFVAPGLIMTARHVVDDYWRHLTGQRLTGDAVAALDGPVAFSIVANQIVEGRRVQWDIARMFAGDPMDIVLLEAQRHDGTPLPSSWPVAAFSFMPPAVGERIYAVGFPFQKYEPKDSGKFSWEQRAALAGGEVDEVHAQRRDIARLPFPCFRTNARFDGGMSGGPVVNERGQVCGVICQSLPSSAPDEDHASYVSLLWPCLSYAFTNLAWISPPAAALTFRDMFAQGFIDSPDWETVQLSEDGRTAVLRLAAS